MFACIDRRIWLVIGIAVLLCFTLEARGEADKSLPGQKQCPVRPEKAALKEFSTLYQGRVVYFCCDDCVQKFVANPQAYLSRLPELAAPGVKRFWEGWTAEVVLSDAIRFFDDHQPIFVFYLLLFVMVWIAIRSRRRAVRKNPEKDPRGIMPPLTYPSVVLNFLLIGFLGEVGRCYYLSVTANRVAAEAANYYSGGERSSLYQNMFQDAAAQTGTGELQRTYYRGNDERNDSLFNGGRYRTVTFHVSVQTEEGTDVSPGDTVKDQNLNLRLEIVRAPNTADSLFTQETMSRYCMMHENEAFAVKKDARRVGLTTTEPNQRWELAFPIGKTPAEGNGHLEGVLYLGSAPGEDGRMSPSAVHYWVVYHLVFEKHQVSPRSRLAMGAALNPVPSDRDGWFSQKPIPENPDPMPSDMDDKPVEGKEEEGPIASHHARSDEGSWVQR